MRTTNTTPAPRMPAVVMAAMLFCFLGLTTVTAPAATLTVTNRDDTGPGSLRLAVRTAVSGDTIKFAPGITDVVLTSDQITLNRNLTIDGDGVVTVRRSSAAPAFRVLEVAVGTDVTIKGLTISGGSSDLGGGILNNGTLTITGSTVADNFADGGGGIANVSDGILHIAATTVFGNSGGNGGGIYNHFGCTLTLTSSGSAGR